MPSRRTGWPHGGNQQAHRYSGPRPDQCRKTSSRLKPAWSFEFDTYRGQEATPIVVDGVHLCHHRLEQGLCGGRQDAERQLWCYDPKVPAEAAAQELLRRRAAAAPPSTRARSTSATYDGRLIALDAAHRQGRSGRPRPPTRKAMYTITGAPRVARGHGLHRQRRRRVRRARLRQRL